MERVATSRSNTEAEGSPGSLVKPGTLNPQGDQQLTYISQTTIINIHDCPEELYNALPMKEYRSSDNRFGWKWLDTPSAKITIFGPLTTVAQDGD